MISTRIGWTILIVEDDAQLRAVYKSALRLEGYTVVTAADGIDALRHVEAASPDAVILDLDLPRLDGYQVGRELALIAPDLPIVVVTGLDMTPAEERAFACVLRKPIDPDALIRAVASCISRNNPSA
jgi:two-component system, OmpR family, response regulator